MRSQDFYQELTKLLEAGWAGLPDKPEETPQTTLSALWQAAAGPEGDQPGDVDPETENQLRELVAKRLGGAPLAYLTGRQLFMGIEFLSSPQAMIPRKETEILAQAALDLGRKLGSFNQPIRVIDLCTGSGNVALTLAYRLPECRVAGADLSEDAVQLSQRNAQHLGLAERARFYQGDLFAPFEQAEFLGQIDLVTCNPPYISSAQVEKLPAEIAQYEPRLAFDGGPFGIKILTRLVREAPRFLKPGGWICFEVGLGQGKAMFNLVNRAGAYQNIQSFSDEAGEVRVLQAQFV